LGPGRRIRRIPETAGMTDSNCQNASVPQHCISTKALPLLVGAPAPRPWRRPHIQDSNFSSNKPLSRTFGGTQTCPMAMSAQQRQDILLYCAKGFNTKQTRDAMLLDARKLHGFQTHSVPSLRSIQRARVRMMCWLQRLLRARRCVSLLVLCAAASRCAREPPCASAALFRPRFATL
jgi:hypothetical protein